MVTPNKTHAANGVPRRVQSCDGLSAKIKGIAVFHLNIGSGNTAACRSGCLCTRVFYQLVGTGDVVSVCVGLNCVAQLQAVLRQHRQVTLYQPFDWVNDDGVFTGLVKHNVGVGAGDGIE
jgi:hypothetical protein